MTPEKAFALTDPEGPVFLPGAFELALGSLKAPPRRSRRPFRSGAGFGWHEHDTEVFSGCERFFRPGLPSRPPAARAGSRPWKVSRPSSRAVREVADLGCGHGASTVLMAEAFPNSHFTGSDYHEGSIEAARERATEGASPTASSFEVAGAQSSRRATSTWSPPSTACTTWATRWVRPARSGGASPTTGPG